MFCTHYLKVQSGIKFERNAQVKSMDVPTNEGTRSPIKIVLEAKGGVERADGCSTEIKCDAYLAAVGRKPMTESLNLKVAGIDVDEFGGLLVDANLRSTVNNVYGAGDVLGRPFLASTGAAQGTVCLFIFYYSIQKKKQIN